MGSSRELASHSTLRRATRLSRGRNARAPGLSGPAKRHGPFPGVRSAVVRGGCHMNRFYVSLAILVAIVAVGLPTAAGCTPRRTRGPRSTWMRSAWCCPFSWCPVRAQAPAPGAEAGRHSGHRDHPRPVRGVRLQPPERLHEHLRADLTSGRSCPGPARSTTVGVSPASPFDGPSAPDRRSACGRDARVPDSTPRNPLVPWDEYMMTLSHPTSVPHACDAIKCA